MSRMSVWYRNNGLWPGAGNVPEAGLRGDWRTSAWTHCIQPRHRHRPSSRHATPSPQPLIEPLSRHHRDRSSSPVTSSPGVRGRAPSPDRGPGAGWAEGALCHLSDRFPRPVSRNSPLLNLPALDTCDCRIPIWQATAMGAGPSRLVAQLAHLASITANSGIAALKERLL